MFSLFSVLDGNITLLNESASLFLIESNHTIEQTNKSLSMCQKSRDTLLADLSLLQKKAKKLSLYLAEKTKKEIEQKLLIRRLKWLHKQHGAFGLY